jgi:hypothetical protein
MAMILAYGGIAIFFIGARCSFGMLKRAFIQIRELAELGNSPERNRPLTKRTRSGDGPRTEF